ncbi:MAG: glutamate racemase [Nitrospirota bacterium]
MTTNPIGVFDSGIGGLTVLKEIHHHLPGEDIIYFGDTARVPYGIKSAETVQRFSHEVADYLTAKDIKMLVVACNTASAAALTSLRESLPIPVIGVLMPGAYAATRATKTGKIGVIGTEGTVNSGAYPRLIRNIRPDASVVSRACPLFVPLVEEGRLSGEITTLAANEYLAALKGEGIDTLVLGCTHYPLIKPVIGEVMGPEVTLIDSAHETAQEVGRVLKKTGLLNGSDRPASISYYVTDAPERFKTVGERFLGYSIGSVHKAELA